MVISSVCCGWSRGASSKTDVQGDHGREGRKDDGQGQDAKDQGDRKGA